MGFYNIKIIMKYVYKALTAIFAILVIVLAILLCIPYTSFGATIGYQGVNGSGFSQADFNDINNSFNNVKGTAQYYFVTLTLGDYAKMIIIDETIQPTVYAVLSGYSNVSSIDSYHYRVYNLLGNGRASLIQTSNGVLSNFRFDYNQSDQMPYVCGNIPIYNSNLTDVFWAPEGYVVPSFNAPYLLPNADDSQTSQDALTTGSFRFFKVEPGDVPKTSPIYMDIWDTTFSEPEYLHNYVLDENSVWFEEPEEGRYYYLLITRFMSWFNVVNGKSYKITLQYLDTDTDTMEFIDYTWTFSLTTSQQDSINDDTLQNIDHGIGDINNGISDLDSNIQNIDNGIGDINNGVSDINSFLNDNSIDNNTVINSLPNYDFSNLNQFTNPLDILFTKLYQMFTLNTQEVDDDFVFTFPFSNVEVTIPADYVETHCPQAIIVIIRLFYWYIISRFVVKSALRDIDKFRQGDFIRAEEDIKTEVL